MTRTIHLITEDETDVKVVRAILKAKKADIRVRELLPPGNAGGLSRLVKNLDKLIKTAQSNAKKGDCIAVLHDADLRVQLDRTLYNEIAKKCKDYGIVQVIAKDEIEAWILADEGVCSWLGEKPKNQDNVKQPSVLLSKLVNKKTGKGYSGPRRDQVMQKIDGTGDKYSPSMKKVVQYLLNKGCIPS